MKTPSYLRVVLPLMLSAVAILGPGSVLGAPAEAAAKEAALLIALAKEGNEGAQIQVAGHYLDGSDGFPRDPRQAAGWFEQAAIHGSAYAQMRLGDLYAEGTGVARNPRVAADWREKAANRGNTEAQLKLGLMFLHGEGVARNPLAGEYWIERASIEGNAQGERARARPRFGFPN